MAFQNLPPKSGTEAPAPAAPQAGAQGTAAPAPGGGASQQPQGFGGMQMLLPFALMAVFLFMSFRKQKKETEARKSLKKGDKVVTQAGLIGELTELDEKVAKVKLGPGMVVSVLASSVGPFVEAAPAGDNADKLSDLKEAKASEAKK